MTCREGASPWTTSISPPPARTARGCARPAFPGGTAAPARASNTRVGRRTPLPPPADDPSPAPGSGRALASAGYSARDLRNLARPAAERTPRGRNAHVSVSRPAEKAQVPAAAPNRAAAMPSRPGGSAVDEDTRAPPSSTRSPAPLTVRVSPGKAISIACVVRGHDLRRVGCAGYYGMSRDNICAAST
jgi:hypothetical protein